MLLVVRAEAAVIGAAELGAALKRQRLVARLDEILAEAPIGRIGRDQRRLHAVLTAALFVPDFVADDLNLRRHERQTGLAQRLGLAPEHIRPRSTQRRVHLWGCLVASAPSRSWRPHRREPRRRES